MAFFVVLALVAFGLAIWCDRRWRTIKAKAEQVAAQLTTCTSERDRARMEAAALRTVLERMGCAVTCTWTEGGRHMNAHVARSTPATRQKPVGRPWLN